MEPVPQRGLSCLRRTSPRGNVLSPNHPAFGPNTLPRMDRRLARRNLRTALITSIIGLLMFALTFVAALMYVGS